MLELFFIRLRKLIIQSSIEFATIVSESDQSLFSMKISLVFLLLFGLLSCSYSSRKEAKDACDQWKARMKSVTITSFRDEQPSQPVDRIEDLNQILLDIQNEDLESFRNAAQFREESKAFQIRFFEQLEAEDKKGREMVNHQVVARWCVGNPESRQFIGYENKSVVSGQWINQQGRKGRGQRVRYFRY